MDLRTLHTLGDFFLRKWTRTCILTSGDKTHKAGFYVNLRWCEVFSLEDCGAKLVGPIRMSNERPTTVRRSFVMENPSVTITVVTDSSPKPWKNRLKIAKNDFPSQKKNSSSGTYVNFLLNDNQVCIQIFACLQNCWMTPTIHTVYPVQ